MNPFRDITIWQANILLFGACLDLFAAFLDLHGVLL